jgi:hypothetical protein
VNGTESNAFLFFAPPSALRPVTGSAVFVTAMERVTEGPTAALATVRLPGGIRLRRVGLLRVGTGWGVGMPRRYREGLGWENLVELDPELREQVRRALIDAYHQDAP